LDKKYNGVRFTADGFDCALPVSIDSHTVCSYSCQYCFSEFLGGHTGNYGKIGQFRLETLDSMLNGKSQSKISKAFRQALKREEYAEVGKPPCPVQMGALTDPFDNIERQQGWSLQAAEIFKKNMQPCRISTKGNLFKEKEYLKAYDRPDLFWVAFSIISIDDDMLMKIDKNAPPPSERLKAMAALSAQGISTSLRFRPLIPNVSDRTKKHPNAYVELIEKSAEAGARAVSIEMLFAPRQLIGDTVERWDKLESIIRFPLRDIYKRITPKSGSCIRPSRAYAEDLFLHAREVAHKCGMTFGVSDPIMKHLNDTGCCCGIKPNDPHFGNWQRENATNALVDARDKKIRIVGRDYIPEWSHNVPKHALCARVGWQAIEAQRTSWAETLRENWNDLRNNRGPLVYFQNLLKPVALDDGDIVYEYAAPKRHNCKTPVLKSVYYGND
jgi:DNA repair photolyase